MLLGLLIFAPIVVVEIKRVDKIAKQRQPLFTGFFLGLIGRRRLFGGHAFLFVERHASLVKHMLLNVDWHICPYCERDRIAWPRVDLDCMATLLDDDARVEG